MVGGRVDDGFKTLVTFSEGALSIWTKTVKPPGVTGGGPIATTTMVNTRIRTKAPKQLYEITDGEMKAAYDPAVLIEIIGQLQVLQQITVTFADNATQVFWGWLEEFMPDDVSEGEQPVATVKFCCSGESDVGVETAPVFGSGS